MSKKPPLTIWEALGTLAGLGFTIAVPIAVFTIGGYYLDGYTHTKPLFILLGLLLGLISGIYGAYRLLSRVLQRG
jgi:ATP synthase protein I